MSFETTPLKIMQCVGGTTPQSQGGSFTIPLHPENDNIAVLQSALSDSVSIEWEVNSTYQASFTAYDDGSEAFNLLEVQNMVQIEDQWFMIKQLEPDYSGGITTIQVTLSHISNEISRLRCYPDSVPIDWGEYSHNGQGSVTSTEVASSDDDSQQVQVTPDDLMKWITKNNSDGVTYQIIGKFSAVSTTNPYTEMSLKDMVDKVLELWPDAVFFPDNLNLRIYSHDAFYQNNGHRIDYLHDTSEIQLTYDSTNMLNAARLVGASYSQDTTSDTGLSTGAAGKGAAAVQADARKYLGVPYKWGGAGGARGGNPMSGMDCSSFVSQVYKDMGINIPAYTVAMEAYGHQVSSPQTGDMGFYGSHGASYHITLALDSSKMIYEPQPGESCKETPISWYPPTWWERNDQMAAVVAAGGNGPDATTTDSKEMYYFSPFWFEDEDSVKRWGIFAGDDITSDTIQDPAAMKTYAETQFKPNPDLSIQATLDDNNRPIAGDVVRVAVLLKNWVTTVDLVGFTWYPRSNSTQSTVTYNSNAKNILDFDNSVSNNAKNAQQREQVVVQNTTGGRETWTASEVKAYDDSKRS